ncbi:MAG: hypothetical protein U5K79_23545 [Cyclobacteriaceae bacterium]|nr:hypothetical protein [Cyclobacteriaceae bacterium]
MEIIDLLEEAGQVTIKVEPDRMEIGEAAIPAMVVAEDRGRVATGLKVVIRAEIEQVAVIREVTEQVAVTRVEADLEVADIRVAPARVVIDQVVVGKVATGKVAVIRVDTGKVADTPSGIDRVVTGKVAAGLMAIVPVVATRVEIVREATNKEADIREEIITTEADILQETPAMINQEATVKTGEIIKVISRVVIGLGPMVIKHQVLNPKEYGKTILINRKPHQQDRVTALQTKTRVAAKSPSVREKIQQSLSVILFGRNGEQSGNDWSFVSKLNMPV